MQINLLKKAIQFKIKHLPFHPNSSFLCQKVLIPQFSFSFSSSKSSQLPLSSTPPTRPYLEIMQNRIKASIEDSAPKIKELVEQATPGQRNCIKHLITGAMSHGSINYLAHSIIAVGVNLTALFVQSKEDKSLCSLLEKSNYHDGFRYLLDSSRPLNYGPKSNSGEGGELYLRDRELTQSYIRQIASGRFGVDLRYMVGARELQIKINQGAKPGVGGQLPGIKVTDEIAQARYAVPGISLISPPPHHDIYSIEDLRQLIYDLRSVNPDATISVKIASLAGCGTIAVGVAKCYGQTGPNDKINISIAGPGGTGAATLTDKHEINQAWETGLSEVHQTLVREGFRKRVTLTVSGGIQTGMDAFKAILLGADFVEVGSAALVSLGCIMIRKCHEGNCPTGIATNDYGIIEEKFKGKPDHVAKLLMGIAKSLDHYLRMYGLQSVEEAVGRSDLLMLRKGIAITSLEKLIALPELRPELREKQVDYVDEFGSSIQEKIVIKEIINGKTNINLKSNNAILSFGARIGFHNLQKKIIHKPIIIKFSGLANGQSFGFATPENIILICDHSNDGTGKALSGGEIYITKISGNCLGYGATSGYIASRTCGDRAGIRLSHKARIVLRETGNNSFNFMTGGVATIIGDKRHYGLNTEEMNKGDSVGPNLGSGFTGGRIMMPKKLYIELKERGYLSKTVISNVIVKELENKELEELINDFRKYNFYIRGEEIVEWCLADTNRLKSHFIALHPKKNETPKLINIPSLTMETNRDLDSNDIQSPIIGFKSDGQAKLMKEKDNCGVGMLARLDGASSKDLVEKTIEIIGRFEHRGSIGLEKNIGDGCGIMWFGYHSFFIYHFKELNLKKHNFGVLFLCLNDEYEKNAECLNLLSEIVWKESLKLDGVRDVPVDNSFLSKNHEIFYYKQYIILKPNEVEITEFETKLMKIRLSFEFKMQRDQSRIKPHIFSCSLYHLIYKSLIKETFFSKYFLDLNSAEFKCDASIVHVRFATNTLPQIKNIQPLSRLANNGENNNIRLIERVLEADPEIEELLGIKPNASNLSDSHVLSLFLDYFLIKMKAKTSLNSHEIAQLIVQSIIHPFIPVPLIPDIAKEQFEQSVLSDYHNTMGIPFEGPNASVAVFDNQIIVFRDKNGFRPLRGVADKEYLYIGSELGPIELINGDAFNLDPGKPLSFDLEKRSYNFISNEPSKAAKILSEWKDLQWNNITTGPQVFSYAENPLQMKILDLFSSINANSSEIEILKLRAGWSSELDQHIMERMYRGEELLSSMADQGPMEMLVSGTNIDLGGFFKAKYSQITNPPLAKREEECFMSTVTLAGRKSELGQFGDSKGILVDSPILDNNETKKLLEDSRIKCQIVSLCYEVDKYEEGIRTRLKEICEHCSREIAENKVNLIVLSDLITPENKVTSFCDKYANIPPVLVSSVLDQRLLQKGLRRKASIVLQAANMLTGRDIAQAISIGGADFINPYLGFLCAGNHSQEIFLKRSQNYKEKLRNELLGFMARMGISSVTAYRGAKVFQAIGLEKELAELYGVTSEIGGFGLKEMVQIIISNHWTPNRKGTGKYDGKNREFIWNPEITQTMIHAIRNDDKDNFKKFEELSDKAKKGSPRGWLTLKKPTKWTEGNPLPICILGGGAAAFYQTQSLLESELPITITMLERNPVNLFGLVGEGIAPDHLGTKKQGYILRKCLEDFRVNYYGGIDVGGNVRMEEISKTFPCIIDCRGATTDLKLNIEGESLKQVLSASQVYKSYNGVFQMSEHWEWPLNSKSNFSIKGQIIFKYFI